MIIHRQGAVLDSIPFIMFNQCELASLSHFTRGDFCASPLCRWFCLLLPDLIFKSWILLLTRGLTLLPQLSAGCLPHCFTWPGQFGPYANMYFPQWKDGCWIRLRTTGTEFYTRLDTSRPWGRCKCFLLLPHWFQFQISGIHIWKVFISINTLQAHLKLYLVICCHGRVPPVPLISMHLFVTVGTFVSDKCSPC